MNETALRSKRRFMLLPLLAAVTLAGCAVGPTKEDPYEPFNRAMEKVHRAMMRHYRATGKFHRPVSRRCRAAMRLTGAME